MCKCVCRGVCGGVCMRAKAAKLVFLDMEASVYGMLFVCVMSVCLYCMLFGVSVWLGHCLPQC